ncbi:MAG: hypothetical protein PHE32_00125 [Candidatus Shapirobacteria bacterium]|nr:hypothetical protein [Candidatus Shapirobacteria bacterium]MDD4410107.1 hypothetical protein [Candidatus Shapirobacteria bacterium]
MLPKVEKIKKNSGSELEQPGLFDKENEKDRIAKKRRFVYIAMALTIGLSLSFWIYRSVRNFNFSFKLPTFNFAVSTPKTNTINLPQDGSNWSVFLKRVNPESVIYQRNENIFFNDEKLNATNFITKSIYSSSLPDGLKIKELVEENNNTFSYFSKIVTPSQELLLIIKIDSSSDLSQSKKLIPGLIDQLYWYSLQK